MEPNPEFKTEGQTLDFANAETTPAPEPSVPLSVVYTILRGRQKMYYDLATYTKEQVPSYSQQWSEFNIRYLAVGSLGELFMLYLKENRSKEEDSFLRRNVPELFTSEDNKLSAT